MNLSRRGVGGAARGVAPRGVGSSPAVSTFPKTNNIKTLRRMLSDRDRKLQSWDRLWKKYGNLSLRYDEHMRNDNERRLIREKIKRLSRENK